MRYLGRLTQAVIHGGDIFESDTLAVDADQGRSKCFLIFLSIDRRDVEMLSPAVKSTCRKDRRDIADRLVDCRLAQPVGIEFLLIEFDQHLFVRISPYLNIAQVGNQRQSALERIGCIDECLFAYISGDRDQQQRILVNGDLGNGFIHICRQIPLGLGDDILDIGEHQLFVTAMLDIRFHDKGTVLYRRIDRIDI